MDEDYLDLIIRYDNEKDDFEVAGNVNPVLQAKLVGDFLRGQPGSVRDSRLVSPREFYEIKIRLYPKENRISVIDNIGNDRFRDGILYVFLGKLPRYP